MLTALLGIAYSAVIMQADVVREHLHFEPIVVYAGQIASADDPSSWIYRNRQGYYTAGNVQWLQEKQYS